MLSSLYQTSQQQSGFFALTPNTFRDHISQYSVYSKAVYTCFFYVVLKSFELEFAIFCQNWTSKEYQNKTTNNTESFISVANSACKTVGRKKKHNPVT